MHSNSKVEHVVGRSWILIWVVAFGLLFTLVLTVESAWRSLGYRPSAVDSPALWKFWYDRAVHGGPQTIAIIGSSRIQAGISTGVMRDRLPDYRIVQVAKYARGSPIGILRALASDDRFTGVVICDTIEPFLMRKHWEDQRKLFEDNRGWRAGIEAIASATVLEHLAVRSKDTGVWAAITKITRGSVPFPRHICMLADRSLQFDFSAVKKLEQFTKGQNASFRRRYEELEFPPPEGLDKDVAEIEGFVDSIQARGGQVVFLRMPSSGARLALENEYHPKAKYWDRLAAMTSGVWVHPTDFGDRRGWQAPDESHLDYRDATRFTEALVDELLRRGVVKRR